MNKTILSRSVLSFTAAFAIVLASCNGGQQSQQMQMPAPQIATITLNYESSDLTNNYPATIKGKTDVEIRPQVSGFITEVCVDEGQHVQKGQKLFVIDQVQYQAAVDQAQAAVNSASTALNTTKLTVDKKAQLYAKNIISEYEYQLAKNDLAMAEAQLAQANAALTTAKKNLSYTVVTAPSSGIIGSIPNRQGSLASPSMVSPLTTVSDNGDVYAYFSLTEKDILNMTENGKYTLDSRIKELPSVKLRLADGTIYPFEGKVATVSGVIDRSTGAASVRAIFPNENGMLRSGSTGQILLPTHLDSVIVVPQKATTELQDIRYAYVVGDSNIVHSVPVVISPLSDGKNFVVTSGLKAGDRIAIEGVGTIVRNGTVITPVDPAAAPQQQAMPAQQ